MLWTCKNFFFRFINRAAVDVFTCQTLLKHVKGLVFFFLWNIYFPLVLALDSMGIINKLKRYYVAMECADLEAFTFATWQIRSCLLYELIWPDATVMTLFAILRVSRVSWGKWIELFGCFIAASSETVKKLKYLQAKQRMCRECKNYVTGREITTELKITVDNAILELCDSCDFFASPLIKRCAVVSTVIDESSRTALECALRSSKTLFSAQTHLGTYVNLYSSERSMTWPSSLNLRYAKNVIRNTDWEAIYHFLATTHRQK